MGGGGGVDNESHYTTLVIQPSFLPYSNPLDPHFSQREMHKIEIRQHTHTHHSPSVLTPANSWNNWGCEIFGSERVLSREGRKTGAYLSQLIDS